VKIFKAGQINPSAWWALGLSLAISAALVTRVDALLVIIATALAITFLARERTAWSKSLGFYLFTAGAVIVIRVIFRVVFNFDTADNIALNLPVITISLGVFGQVDMFGRVSWAALFSALQDGLRMAAIILSIGLANTLANPRRLLKNTPGALYEVASAWVIAINMAPQLIQSTQRVRSARRLRGRTRRQHLTSSLLIPVLEDTIDRSLALAASMSSRGFGRLGELSKREIMASRSLSVMGVIALAIGSYLLLTSKDGFVPLCLIVFGCLGVLITSLIAGRRQIHTRYRPDQWRKRDFVVLLASAGFIAAAIFGGR
jgi:energy-coupling factor transport system permease protein